jgi:hypothetical protein
MEFQGPEAGELFIGGMAGLIGLVFALLTTVLYVIVWWKIFAKAGYSGVLGLLMLVPIANLILPLVLAFGTWPIHEELELARMRAAPR